MQRSNRPTTGRLSFSALTVTSVLLMTVSAGAAPCTDGTCYGGQHRSQHAQFAGHFGELIDLFDGTLKLSVPIASTPGRHQFGASLALTYNQVTWFAGSAGGQTPTLGKFWSISIPERCNYCFDRLYPGDGSELKAINDGGIYHVPPMNWKWGLTGVSTVQSPTGTWFRFASGLSLGRSGDPVDSMVNGLGDGIAYKYGTFSGRGETAVSACYEIATTANANHKILLAYDSVPGPTGPHTEGQYLELREIRTKADADNAQQFSNATNLKYSREGGDSNSSDDGNPLWRIVAGGQVQEFRYTDEIPGNNGGYWGRLIDTIIQPSGARVALAYDVSGGYRITSYTMSAGQTAYTWTFNYSDTGDMRYTVVIDPDGNASRYIHNMAASNPWGLLVRTETFANGAITGTPLARQDKTWIDVLPGANAAWHMPSVTSDYSQGQLITTARNMDYDSRVWRAKVTSIEDNLGVTRLRDSLFCTYDPTSHFLYDDSVVSNTGAKRRVVRQEYVDVGSRTKPISKIRRLFSSDTLITQFTYNAQRNLSVKTFPQGNTHVLGYSTDGIFPTVDPFGSVTAFGPNTGSYQHSYRNGQTGPAYRDISEPGAANGLSLAWSRKASLTDSTTLFQKWAHSNGMKDSVWSMIDTNASRTAVYYRDPFLRPCSTRTRTRISGTNSSWVVQKTTYGGWNISQSMTLPRDATKSLTTYLDPLGRPVRVQYPDGRKDSTVYAAFQTTVLENYNGAQRTTRRYFDYAGRDTLLQDAEGGETRWSYGDDGRLTAVINAAGQTTSYGYDSRDMVRSITSVDRGAVFQYRNSNGILRFTKDGLGVWSYVKYDTLDRMIELGTWPGLGADTTDAAAFAHADNSSYPTVSVQVKEQYTYAGSDIASIVNSDKGETTTYTFQFNAWGSPTQKTIQYAGLPNKTYRFKAYYNAANTLTKFLYPTQFDNLGETDVGMMQYFSFYPDGQLKSTWVDSVTLIGPDVTRLSMSRSKGFVYDTSGFITEMNFEEPMTATASTRCRFAYDSQGRLISRLWARDSNYVDESFGYRLTWDAFGITQVDTITSSGAWAYEKKINYDRLQRITREEIPGLPVANYSYDAVGNIDTASGNAYHYYAGTNRLKSIGSNPSAVQFVYDSLGRLTSDLVRGHGLHWNWAGKLDSVYLGLDANNKPRWLLNWYDAKGQRIRSERHYYVKYLCPPGDPDFAATSPDSGFDQLSESSPFLEQNSASSGPGEGNWCYKHAVIRRYYLWWGTKTPVVLDSSGVRTDEVGFYLGSERLWSLTQASGSESNVLVDHVGSTRRAVLRVNESVSSYVDYNAWGSRLSVSGANTTFSFTDQSWEEHGNLDYYYFGARWYDPERRRFTSPDPIVRPDESPYGYASCNPLESIDPTGKEDYGDPWWLTQGREKIYSEDPFGPSTAVVDENGQQIPPWEYDSCKKQSDWRESRERQERFAKGKENFEQGIKILQNSTDPKDRDYGNYLDNMNKQGKIDYYAGQGSEVMYYDADDEKIHVNVNITSQEDPSAVAAYAAHEAQHAMDHEDFKKKNPGSTPADFKFWANNTKHGVDRHAALIGQTFDRGKRLLTGKNTSYTGESTLWFTQGWRSTYYDLQKAAYYKVQGIILPVYISTLPGGLHTDPGGP